MSNRTVSDGATILLIDDNPQVAQAISVAFDCAGYRIDIAADPEAALSTLSRARYDAILLDLNFRPGQTDGAEGLALLERIVADDPEARVIVITAHSGIRRAVAAMQGGAVDFVMKPWRNADLIARVETAIATRPRLRTAVASEGGTSDRVGRRPGSSASPRLLGESPAIEAVRATIRKVAPTAASVIVSGRSGTGRSLTAALLHDGSPRSGTPPVSADVRDPASWSRIEDAVGTLILRHPDELDEVAQDRLRECLPAAARSIAIVTAPQRLSPRLRDALGTIEIALPPLADRGADALLLARHFAVIAAERHARPIPVFTATAEAAILAGDWPDEVRGLARAVERAVLLDEDGIIDGAALAEWRVPTIVAHSPAAATGPLDISLHDSERLMIEAALRRHKHNVSHAAAALGLTRQTLYRRMTRYGL